jgi:hypothetical protein
MATVGEDDRHKMLKDLLDLRQSSIVSELLAIEQHAEPVEKAHKWARDLLCLRYRASSDHCFRKTHNYALKHNFVAVSWTRQPSARESSESGKYSVEHPHEYGRGKTVMQRNLLDIRNSVLDRVVSYLEARNMDTFWIDKACINQTNAKQKAEAINSMDLVYKNATKSVGLLSTPIYATTGAQLLGRLLNGDLSFEDDSGNFQIYHNVPDKTVVKTIRILKALVQDSWWDRAWIYQEEYLSGPRMDLLIPVERSVQVPERYDLVAGEFCVQATKFRKQATIFLLACFDIRWEEHHAICSEMLSKVERYSITLKRSDGGLNPMSSTIFADIEQRGVENAWDTLAITANTCAYETRLDVKSLTRERRSLSLCLLAQFLLNGEIFICGTKHDKANRNSLMYTVHGLLDQIQPAIDDLPISTKELTFLKYCRMPSVRFCVRGLETDGYIWDLPKHANLSTSDFNLPNLSGARKEYLESYPWESFELKVLVEKLKQRKEFILAAGICGYLEKRRENSTSPALNYMDLMACKLIQAIDRGFQLRLANLPGQRASGIFVPRRWELSRPMNVLTTWQPPQKGLNEQGNAVSLKVSLGVGQVVKPIRWINGMVFFSRDERKDVLIGWPFSWTRSG